MDVLILHGMYAETIGYLNEYRKLRPDGKVYCGLDMNRYWMGRIIWDDPLVRRFAAQCDVIATSCKSLRDALNRNPKVGFPCRFFPNGFYNAAGIDVTADAKYKKNAIITVGRIGTEQKNNQEMLIAFAKASPSIPNWKLKLIGPVEQGFKPFISEYFKAHPYLKQRVFFPGAINDKNELYKEYARVKIFALTSTFEGGAPNVFAEALVHGCKFITSDIDAADDITNNGELGIKYKLHDIDGLANAMIKLCSESKTADFEEYIPKARSYAARYYDWNRNAKKLTYMLFN